MGKKKKSDKTIEWHSQTGIKMWQERQTVPEKKKVACDTYEWMRQNNNNVGGGVLFC